MDRNQFYEACRNKGKTIIVIKSDHNQIFGGYTDLSWKLTNDFIEGKGNSFLFSLTKETKHNCLRKSFEIIGGIYGISFGGSDLTIYYSYKNSKSDSRLGLIY